MRRTLPWPILLPVLFGVCVAPNAWGWAELFDRANDARPGARMVDLHKLIESEARQNRLPVDFVAAILHIESAGRPCSRSHTDAQGLLQLMKNTGRRYGVDDRYVPAANVRAGAAHLAETLQLAGGDMRLAAAVYNAGPKVLNLPERRWPAETREYVNVRLPRTLSAFQGGGWRLHLPRYVPHVDRYDCHMVRSN